MSSQGSAYSRFQRALKTGNLAIIRSAAANSPSSPQPARVCDLGAKIGPFGHAVTDAPPL